MGIKKHIQCGILCLFFLSANLFGQTGQLYFKHLTTDNGLSQGVVNDILVDKKGFVWFSTYDGINRFDGTNCISNNQIASGMEGISVTHKILEDKTGDIWIGSNEALIHYSYQTNRFEKIIFAASSIGSIDSKISFYKLLAVNENNLLMQISYFSYLIYNTNTKKITCLAIPDNLRINEIKGAAAPAEIKGFENRVIFIKQVDDGYYFCKIIDRGGNKYQWEANKLPSINHNLALYNQFVSTGSLFYLTGENHWIYDYNFSTNQLKKTVQLPIDKDEITNIVQDDKNNLWMTSNSHGLFVYNNITKALTNYRHNDVDASSLLNDNSGSILAYKNMLWVSSWGKGINYCRLTDNGFSHHFTKEEAVANKTDNFIRGMVLAIDGNYYCNTQFGGMVQLDSTLKYKKTVSDISSSDIGIDKTKSNIFFGNERLQQYNLQSKKVISFFNSKKEQKLQLGIWQGYYYSQLKSGKVLASTLSGLRFIDTKENDITEPAGVNDGAEQVTLGYEDRNGNIYKSSATYSLQLFMPSGSGYKLTYSFAQKFVAKHIYEVNDTTVWIATTYGLYLFNPQKLEVKKHFTVDDGLPNNVVYAIAPDSFERLWLSTNKGISMFTKATNRFRNYSGTAGMQGNEYNSHTVVTAGDGRIIFGGVNGLTAIRPWAIKTETTFPIIQFTAIKADSSINPFQFNEAGSSVLQLTAGSSTLELSFVAIDYNNPTACHFKYKLTGYDDDWVLSKNPGYARYVQLKPGSYTFEIMVANADDIWSKEIKKLRIKINAPWWQQLWFKLLMIFLSIVIMLFAIRQYIRQKLYRQRMQIEKQQAIVHERDRITADLHDDVGATLSSMHIYGDLAKNVWDTQPNESKKMIDKISNTSKDLMNRMGDIIWSMKPADEEKYSFTVRLKNYSTELLAPKNILAEFEIDEALAAGINSPEVRKNLLLIAKEAINNIAKYSEASKATISFKKQNEMIMLSITDDGKGFDSTDKQKGNGLQNIEQRCKLLNGTVTVIAPPGQGVSINCSFPIATIRHR